MEGADGPTGTSARAFAENLCVRRIDQVGERVVSVRSQGRPRGAHDLIVAASALATDREVVSADSSACRDLPRVRVRRGRGRRDARLGRERRGTSPSPRADGHAGGLRRRGPRIQLRRCQERRSRGETAAGARPPARWVPPNRRFAGRKASCALPGSRRSRHLRVGRASPSRGRIPAPSPSRGPGHRTARVRAHRGSRAPRDRVSAWTASRRWRRWRRR